MEEDQASKRFKALEEENYRLRTMMADMRTAMVDMRKETERLQSETHRMAGERHEFWIGSPRSCSEEEEVKAPP